MKTYVKKNGRFEYIGEGTVYSKNRLVLREDGEGNGDANTLTLTNNSEGGTKASASEIKHDAKQELQAASAISKPKQFSVQPNEVAGVTPNTSPAQNSNVPPPTANVAENDPNLETNIINNAKNNTITNIKPANEGVSVSNKKKINEMRMNSVPFTKRELSSLLKRR